MKDLFLQRFIYLKGWFTKWERDRERKLASSIDGHNGHSWAGLKADPRRVFQVFHMNAKVCTIGTSFSAFAGTIMRNCIRCGAAGTDWEQHPCGWTTALWTMPHSTPRESYTGFALFNVQVSTKARHGAGAGQVWDGSLEPNLGLMWMAETQVLDLSVVA